VAIIVNYFSMGFLTAMLICNVPVIFDSISDSLFFQLIGLRSFADDTG